jgi:hypothetical protein
MKGKQIDGYLAQIAQCGETLFSIAIVFRRGKAQIVHH